MSLDKTQEKVFLNFWLTSCRSRAVLISLTNTIVKYTFESPWMYLGARCAGILVGHPLDTVKVRIQTQDYRRPQYKGTFDCFRSIVRQESFSGLYKGMSSPLAGVAVINAIVFGVYGNLQKNLCDSKSLASHFTAGAVAGVVQSFVCSPVELAKTRMQLQKGNSFGGPTECLRHIFKAEGLRGVFRGLNLTVLREGCAFGVYFAGYEWLTRSEDFRPVGTLHVLAAGGTSGAASWLCTYPVDVLKSRIQADGLIEKRIYKNSIDCLLKSTKSEGIGFLFRGLTPTLIRAFPTNAATWTVVTWIMRLAEEDGTSRLVESRHDHSDKRFLGDFASSTYSHAYDFCFVHSFYLKYFNDESS